jgi:MFS family permease
LTAPRPSLWRHRDFMKLWSAETVSQFGTQVTLLALPLIAANVLKVSPFEFGLLATIEFLPFVLVSLPAGVWVDRMRRRPILIVGDVGRALSLASIPIAYELGVLSIWQLYVVGFVNGVLTVFFDVAYQSYLPSLVDRSQLIEGNSKLETTRSAAQITGPGVAGVLIGAVTAPIAILLDAISYILSAAFVFGIRRHEPAPEPQVDRHGNRTSMRTEIAEGMRFVLGNRYLRGIAGSTGSFNLFSNIAFGILVLYLVRDRAFTPEMLGAAFSLGSVGFLVGALTANRFGRRFGVGPTIIGSSIAGAPAILLVAAAPPELTFAAVAASGFLGGVTGAVYNINQVSFRQAICPERMQGRMNATMRFIVWGTIPVGSTLGGALGSTIGLHSTIWVGGIGLLFTFLPVLLSPVRDIHEMPSPAHDRAALADAAFDETPEPNRVPLARPEDG